MSAREKESKTTGRSRGRPRLEDVAALESKLLDVALEEFLHHGYGGTSMTRIVNAAGVSKTTLYSRFSSKEQLFLAIIRNQIEYLSPDSVLSSLTIPPNLEQGLNAYGNHILKVSLEGALSGVNRLIYSEYHRFPELGKAAKETTARGITRVSNFIQACAEFDGTVVKDPDGVAEAFIFMIRGWYTHLLLTSSKVSGAEREKWVSKVVRILMASRQEW